MYTYLKSLLKKVETKLPIWLHGALVLASFALVGASNTVLDASYAASRYPVPYAVGQTAFSGEKLRAYYSYMLEQGTLNIYWQTQFIDFAFIAAMFIAGLVVSLFLARLHKKGSALYKMSLAAAIIVPLGALFDVAENFVSFVMLSQPLAFPNWLALVYSGFAVLKFSAIGLGYSLWVLSVLGFVLVYAFRKLRGNFTTAKV